MGRHCATQGPVRRQPRITGILTLIGAIAWGCGTFRPPNQPLDRVDPDHGYRPTEASRHRDPGRIWLTLAFSGGGTRAASLAYGVLEELRDTLVVVDGTRLRLIDEVDTLSGVSGGSFPAAYYGLFGDRIFEEFEKRFLKRNVQRTLVRRTLAPWNAIRLLTPYLNRSDLAARFYHEDVFDGATFADLAAARGPRVYINATDLPSGTTFRFHQETFDIICSDLNEFWISYAVAASSAVPVLLSPVTLRNYAGRCGFEPPDWFEDALRSRRTNPRGYRAAASAVPFLDAERKKFIHLVDGGISDNLGLRPSLDRIAAMGGVEEAARRSGLEQPDHVVVVVVNAENEPDPTINLAASAPSLAASLNLVSGSQIRRLNFETLMLGRSFLKEIQTALSTPDHPVSTHFVEVSFDMIEEEEERRYFKRLPTSFVLSDEQVDRLREVAGRLLRESPEFRQLVDRLQ
jgi:NTE family protein